MERLAQNLFISPPTLPQLAAQAVFDCKEELDGNVRRYAREPPLLLEKLPRAGFDNLAPADGAFYIYADVSRLTNDSEEFCRRMLAETGVAATPGIDFDPERGHRFMRFSFAGSTADIATAAERLSLGAAGLFDQPLPPAAPGRTRGSGRVGGRRMIFRRISPSTPCPEG